jgi:hypothetical protein
MFIDYITLMLMNLVAGLVLLVTYVSSSKTLGSRLWYGWRALLRRYRKGRVSHWLTHDVYLACDW